MIKDREKIYVTQPALPELNEFIPYLEQIWQSKRVTNQAQFHEQFERELEQYLDVDHVSLFANGTLALVVALQVMRISGEVITTPYSFVATTHALHWNGIKPVFSDIDPRTCNLDPLKLESVITPKTTAILPVHVYGNPCDHDQIQHIADRYGLKVIYDAAHAFGVKKNGASILRLGDVSVLSFHGTKPFNTAEGGAIVCHDKKIKERIDFAKNFGFANETTIVAPGINGKMNELQAALGLAQLKNYKEVTKKRWKIDQYYREEIQHMNGITTLEIDDGVIPNYSYFPVFIEERISKRSREQVYEYLKAEDVYTRRYFYPLISSFSTYRNLESANEKQLTNAVNRANRVLCLPIYSNLEMAQAQRIIHLLRKATQ